MILQNSNLCKNDPSQVISILIQYAQVLYGLNVEKLPAILWEASFQAICERFSGIMIHDIQNAFRYAQIEKKQYTTLTRDELIEPIQQYWFGRILLLQELERFQNLSKAEEEVVNKDIQAREKARSLYLQGLETGKWDGDEFDANLIARNFKDAVSQEIKNELWKSAQKEFYQRQSAAEKISDFFVSVPSAQRIFSRLVIEKCIEKKIKLIID